MSFKSLVELGDKSIREELGEYYYVSKDRINNMTSVLKQQSETIKELSKIISDQQEQIRNLQEEVEDEQRTDK